MTLERSILAGADRMDLENGMQMRLLSALEVLEARREAALLAKQDGERALCANACLLARAMELEGEPLFASGREALAGLTVEEIVRLARKWGEFNRRENPTAKGSEQQTEELKKN